MILYNFTRQAERMLLKLPREVQLQIIHKLDHYLSQPNPLIFAKKIIGDKLPSYRFQIGDYRAIFDWNPKGILITKVGHRREVYRS